MIDEEKEKQSNFVGMHG